MRAGELCARVGVTPKALRYWESLGLLTPGRDANGYRWFDEDDRRAVDCLRDLTAAGVPAGRARPILESQLAGEDPARSRESLATYEALIDEYGERIAMLAAHRASLRGRLRAARRGSGDPGPPSRQRGSAAPAVAEPPSEVAVWADRFGVGPMTTHDHPLTGLM